MKNILVLDIETTGFLNQGACIVEIGIVKLDLDTGKITDVFSSPVREEQLTEEHSQKPFGWVFSNSDLTFDEVMNAPAARYVFQITQNVLNQYPLGCTAFNKKFDFDFLKSRGLKIKELDCPMLLSTDVCKLPGRYSNYKWPNVEEAFKHFYPNVEYKEKHRGLDDARHEAMIVYSLYKLGIFKVNKELKNG